MSRNPVPGEACGDVISEKCDDVEVNPVLFGGWGRELRSTVFNCLFHQSGFLIQKVAFLRLGRVSV